MSETMSHITIIFCYNPVMGNTRCQQGWTFLQLVTKFYIKTTIIISFWKNNRNSFNLGAFKDEVMLQNRHPSGSEIRKVLNHCHVKKLFHI